MITVREARDSDGHELAALLGAVFAEYDGCVFSFAELPELAAVASTFRAHGGTFRVAHREHHGCPVLVGCIGFEPHGASVELKKLYVSARERKSGLGQRLVELVESTARAHNAASIELWSDTRFITAHRFYEARGYVRGTEVRELHDASATSEYFFKKSLG